MQRGAPGAWTLARNMSYGHLEADGGLAPAERRRVLRCKRRALCPRERERRTSGEGRRGRQEPDAHTCAKRDHAFVSGDAALNVPEGNGKGKKKKQLQLI